MADIPASVEGVLDPLLEHNLVRTFSEGASTYFVIEQNGEAESTVSLVGLKDGQASVLYADDDLLSALGNATSIETISANLARQSAPIPAADEGGLGEPSIGALATIENATALSIPSQDAINGAVAGSALRGVNDPDMNSRDRSPPATNHGRLACAWAVNRIVERVLGRPVGGGLSTTNMYGVLKTSDILQSLSSARPGAVVISPTAGTNVGHVGVLGAGGVIFSNSSGDGRWEQNFDVTRWTAYYNGRKGLPVLFYHLNPGRFPNAPVS